MLPCPPELDLRGARYAGEVVEGVSVFGVYCVSGFHRAASFAGKVALLSLDLRATFCTDSHRITGAALLARRTAPVTPYPEVRITEGYIRARMRPHQSLPLGARVMTGVPYGRHSLPLEAMP